MLLDILHFTILFNRINIVANNYAKVIAKLSLAGKSNNQFCNIIDIDYLFGPVLKNYIALKIF